MVYVIGVDIGGTFTDAFAADQEGDVHSAKSLSTPPDYSIGFLNALGTLASELSLSLRELLEQTEYICHGTTATLNALVSGETGRVGFVTTRGHRDSIYIMNAEGRYLGLGAEAIQNILETRKPEPLVPKRLAKEVTERIDSGGRVVVPLDEEGARRAAEELADERVQSIAVSFLWSFRNPKHEKRMREIIRECDPSVHVTLSSEVSPRIREFSRSSTTIMTAQVAPILQGYLDSLQESLRKHAFKGPLLVMQGSGGVMSAKEAPKYAVATIGSVLSGGVSGAEALGGRLGHENIITTDMGGTTFLVGLLVEGKSISTNTTILRQHPLNVSMAYVQAIGSGGGAVAWIDADGRLRVGPRSAGAVPGPACYGRGGKNPTVTDADLLLGILNEWFFLGGRIRIRKDLALRALREKLAGPLKLAAEEAAWGVFEVTNAQAADLVRKTVVEAGYDPRDFVLYAFGGAGPIHCSSYGADLGIGEIVVPLGATAASFSAFGLATSNLMVTSELSEPANYPVGAERINAVFKHLESGVHERLAGQGIRFKTMKTRREIDVRYTLQMAEVPTPVRTGHLTDKDIEKITSDFEEIYERRYGRGTGFREAGFQFITYRVHGRGRLPLAPQLPAIPSARGSTPAGALKGKRLVMLDKDDGFRRTPIYDYSRLRHGHRLEGPAIVEAATTTIVIPDGRVGNVDQVGNIRIRAP